MNPDPAPPSLRTYIANCRRPLAAGVLCTAVTVGFNAALPFIPRTLIDGLEAGTLTLPRMLALGGGYLGLVCIAIFFSSWMRRFPINIGHQVVYDIRRKMFDHLLQLDDAFYHHRRTGDIMTRMTSDLKAIGEMVGQGLLNMVRTILAFVFCFGVMFYLNLELALTMLVILPTMTLIGFAMLRLLRSRYLASQEHFSEMSNFFQESFSGIRLIKGSGSEQRQQGHFEVMNNEFVDKNLALARIESPLWPFMGFTFIVGLIAILVVGGEQVVRGDLQLGVLVQFQLYLLYLQWPMLALGWAMTLFQRGTASWERIRNILEAEPEVRDSDVTDTSVEQVTGDIEFRQVALEMDGSVLLQDINLSIPEGMTVGITGPTGSGKTMLMSLLTRRMDPTEGQVFIGRNDLREIPLSVLRRDVAVAPQEPFLFSETLNHNIQYALEEPDEDRLEWAAGIAQLHEDILSFPEGYRTVLGERGVTLSGGQRQRTSIARSIMGDPQILLLDDTLSAVDTHTEASLLTGLRPIMQERTAVLISHRVSALRFTDFIVVIENGRITQLGSHQDLVQQPGYYRELDTMQRLEARLEAMP